MDEQKLYETEVIFKIKLSHWETCTPERIVDLAKSMLTQHRMTVAVEQIGELTTTPKWPWPKVILK